MKRSTSHRRARGTTRTAFTLVELLVVIGIIALLISILLPTLNKARESAKTTVCLSGLRQMGQGIMMYTNEYQGTLPIGFWNGMPDGSGWDGSQATDWTMLVKSIMSEEGGNFDDDYAAGGGESRLATLFQCPAAPGESVSDNAYTHYSSHPRLMPNIRKTDNYSGQFFKPYKIAKIDESAGKVLIFDGSLQPRTVNGVATGWTADAVGYRLDAYRIDYETFLLSNWDSFTASWLTPGTSIDLNIYPNPGPGIPINSDTAPNWQNIRFRHQGDQKVGILHVDGHASTYGFRNGTETEVTRGMVYVNP